jgi:hypothetical protein
LLAFSFFDVAADHKQCRLDRVRAQRFEDRLITFGSG